MREEEVGKQAKRIIPTTVASAVFPPISGNQLSRVGGASLLSRAPKAKADVLGRLKKIQGGTAVHHRHPVVVF